MARFNKFPYPPGLSKVVATVIGTVTTTFNTDGTITEVISENGEDIQTKVISFKDDGSIEITVREAMGYDDRFYYSQAKIIIKADSSEDGKAVSLHSGNNNTLVNGECSFTVPGIEMYDISLTSGGESISKGRVLCRFGECKTVEI